MKALTRTKMSQVFVCLFGLIYAQLDKQETGSTCSILFLNDKIFTNKYEFYSYTIMFSCDFFSMLSWRNYTCAIIKLVAISYKTFFQLSNINICMIQV